MNPLVKIFLISSISLLAVLLLVHGSKVLIPLAIALLVWFLLNAIANGYRRLPLAGPLIPRTLSLLLSLATILLAGFFVLELVVRNLSEMSTNTVNFQQSLDPLIDRLARSFDLSNTEILNKIFDGIGIEGLFGRIVAAMASFASQFGVVVIYVIFLIVDQQFFDAKLQALVRDDVKRAHIRSILQRVSKDIQRYMWIMTSVSAMTGVLSYAVILWIGVDHAAFWAFLIFILNFIPTIGSIIGTVLTALFALLQFQQLEPVILLVAGIGAIQFVIGNLLQPRLTGRTLNVSQFVVILSLFSWGAIWGVTGMFLAVPITSILMIAFSNFEATRPWAIVLSQDGRLERL